MSDNLNDELSINKKLAEIQRKLNAPKTQRNNFGNYNYRSCEDILQAVKPLLGEYYTLIVSDEIIVLGERFYVKATASIKSANDSISTTAFAREPLSKKGQDESQITGSASSYARKYALNGLLLIDDNKDADSMDNSKETPHPNSRVSQAVKVKERKDSELYKVISGFLADEEQHDYAREALDEITDEEEKQAIWRLFTTKEKEIVRLLKTL
jgi:hypothetical protein